MDSESNEPNEVRPGHSEEAGQPSPREMRFLQRAIVQTMAASGPLPLPSILAEYDNLVPGSAERIIGWAEKQAEHRMSLEKAVVQSDILRSYWGMAAGFAIAIVFGVGGCIVAGIGQPTAGAAIATASVVSLVGVFVYGTHSRKQEREDRAKIMTGEQPSKSP